MRRRSQRGQLRLERGPTASYSVSDMSLRNSEVTLALVLGQPRRISVLILGLRARTSAVAGCGEQNRVLKPAWAYNICACGYDITWAEPPGPWGEGEAAPECR